MGASAPQGSFSAEPSPPPSPLSAPPRGSLLPPRTLLPRPADPTPHPRPLDSLCPTPFWSLFPSLRCGTTASLHLCADLQIVSYRSSVSFLDPLVPVPHSVALCSFPAQCPFLLGEDLRLAQISGPRGCWGHLPFPLTAGGSRSALSPPPFSLSLSRSRIPDPENSSPGPGLPTALPLPPGPGQVLRFERMRE